MNKKSGLKITDEGRVTVAAFESATVDRPEMIAAGTRQLKAFVEKSHPQIIVFDFGQVKFFTSGVLGMLLEIRAELKKSDGEVVISSINPQLHRVFKITNLDKIFRFFPDRESAVKAVSAD